MLYQITPVDANVIVKKLLTFCAAGCVTFGIFVVMAKLVQQDAPPVEVAEYTPTGPIIYQEEDETTITRTHRKPLEEMVEAPPMTKINTQPAEPNKEYVDNFTVTNSIEKVELSKTFGQGFAQEARPIVRVNPKYPTDAARKGIEGWVQLSFSIASDGTVTDIDVIDSQPARVFDREAKRALQKWKYKPTFKNGKAERQTGMSVVLDFKLEQ